MINLEVLANMQKLSPLEITIEKEKGDDTTLNGAILNYYVPQPQKVGVFTFRINDNFSKIMAWCIG
jgi:hypothetical protein